MTEYRKDYYKRNKERMKENALQNYYENRDKRKDKREKRLKMFRERLGGKCNHPGCEETENLQFDHINPASKSFNISNRTSMSLAVLWEEVHKCQLLCDKHHLEKTAGEWVEGILSK